MSTIEEKDFCLTWRVGRSSLSGMVPAEQEFLYAEMKRIASLHLRKESGAHTLQPTALVHEVFLRLRDVTQSGWEDRQYLGLVSATMRRILIDHARKKRSRVRNEGIAMECPTGFHPSLSALGNEEMLVLNDALDELAAMDARQAQIVEMRFFGGFDMGEIATELGLSERTVQREWSAARAWLLLRIRP